MSIIIDGIEQTPKVWDTTTTANVVYCFYPAKRADANDLKHGVIEKIYLTGEKVEYAGGNLKFDKDWAHRADSTYTYSQVTE